MNRRVLKSEFQCEDCGKDFQTEKELKKHENNCDCSQEGSQNRWKTEATDKKTEKEISIAEDLTSSMTSNEYDREQKMVELKSKLIKTWQRILGRRRIFLDPLRKRGCNRDVRHRREDH